MEVLFPQSESGGGPEGGMALESSAMKMGSSEQELSGGSYLLRREKQFLAGDCEIS